MSAHLQEMQVKFQERFDRLEEELRSKNHLIEQLKDHICKLENMEEVSLSVSIVLCMFKLYIYTSLFHTERIQINENKKTLFSLKM